MPASGTHSNSGGLSPARYDAAPCGRLEENARRSRTRGSLGGFLRETRAAVGITAAAVAIMVLGGVALIGDHLWLAGKRALVLNAADAASIATAFELRQRPTSESDEQVEAALRSVAERYARFNVLANTAKKIKPEDIKVTLDVDRTAGTVAVSVKAGIADTLFAKWLYGYEGSGEITTRTGAERDTTRTEVVLAIDVTTSMDDNLAGGDPGEGGLSRMDIVRRAAHVLVDILDPGNEESMIAIGVVPWHINVRLNGTMRADWKRKRWAEYPHSKTYPKPYYADSMPSAETWTMPADPPEEWRGCLDQRTLTGAAPGLSAELPSEASFTMAFFPVKDNTSYQCRDLTRESITGRFRQDCYHGPTPGEFTLGKVEEEVHCPGGGICQYRITPQIMCEDGTYAFAPILPLSRDMDEVRRTINALKPAGSMTYSTMGLIWGRRLLTHEWRSVWGGEIHPVDPDDADSLGVRKAIVLLTDGEDNYGSALGAASDRSGACTAAKDAGMEVFVVAAMNPSRLGSDLSTGLTNCSSKDDHPDRTYVFLENHTKEDLEDAFRQIAHQLLVVRRTH